MMKKEAIILGSILLVLAMVTGILCTNLFGSRDWICNFGNRICWRFDRESVSVQNMIHAVIGTNANSKLEQLEKIIFPEEAYVDAYDARTAYNGRIQEMDDYNLSYDFLVVLPKEKTKLFIGALDHAGFTECYTYQSREDTTIKIPQTFDAVSPEQLSYIFKLEYAPQSKFPGVLVRGLDSINLYIFEGAENTKVIVSS